MFLCCTEVHQHEAPRWNHLYQLQQQRHIPTTLYMAFHPKAFYALRCCLNICFIKLQKKNSKLTLWGKLNHQQETLHCPNQEISDQKLSLNWKRAITSTGWCCYCWKIQRSICSPPFLSPETEETLRRAQPAILQSPACPGVWWYSSCAHKCF